MRRHKDDEAHHHHHSHDVLNAKAMFKAMDLNGDGMVTGDEVKGSVANTDFHVPRIVRRTLSHLEDRNGFSYAQFHEAVQRASKKHALASQVLPRHASVHEHRASHDSLVQADHETVQPAANQVAATTTKATSTAWVSCGGHRAPSCAVCVTTDATGQTVFDHGFEWCHGDCVYSAGKCHPQGTITVSGTVQ